ncbi:MAG: tandem-95 repeat protein [Planctomycetales bacterium]|nr:tandem-95 repeat protein [Planctomycetales bacterium]
MLHSFKLPKRRKSPAQRREAMQWPAMVETLESREMLTISWSSGPDLPEPRTDAVAVVTSDSAVRLVGGNATAATDVPVLANGATAWTLGIGIDTQRNDLGAVSNGSTIYLFGGTGNNEGSDEVLNYDYRLGDSQDLAKMNTIRFDHGYAIESGQAYALGGIGVQADNEIWDSVERYSAASDSWTDVAALPQALHGLSAHGDGAGHIFVFGGSTTIDDTGIQRNSYRYDVATDTWSTVAPMPIGTRDSAVAMDHDGLIYVIGGMTDSGATDAVQVYDPSTNSWSSETALPTASYSLSAVYGPGGKIVVAGGFDAAGTATDTVYLTQDLTIADIAPTFTSSPQTSGSLDTYYTYDVNANGNPVPTYSLITAPTGMSIDATSGLISWQPVDGQVGVHSVVVQASNRAGSVEQAFDITVVADTIAPTTPANFTFDSATQTSVTFSWDASTDAVGVDHYEIALPAYVGPRFGKHWVYTVIDSTTATTWTREGLSPLTSEDYAVRAVDAAGNVSGWSPRVIAGTLAAPTISFSYGTQTTGTIQSPALTPITIQLHSTGNPAATYSIVSGPAAMTINATTGAVSWTPEVADVGLHDIVFRAENSEGSADLTVSIDVTSDAPQLSVQYGPGGGTTLAGTLFTAQVVDHSQTPPTYELISGPAGLTLDSITGDIAWTPAGEQGGSQSVTVRGTSAGGVTDLTFNIFVLFTGPVTGVNVTDLDLLEPTANWTAPTGEGSDLVASYHVHGFAEWGVGRTYTTHTVDYDVPATETSVLLTGLTRYKSYLLTITPFDASGNPGVPDNQTSFIYNPSLPIIRWTVNGSTGGTSLPGKVIAEQPAEVALTDDQTAPSTFELLSGPDGLTFDPSTNIAQWTPTAAQVTSGFSTSDATFRATNYVGTTEITVPIRVYFSGSVRGAQALRNGYSASASWEAPTDNATPIAAYSITRYWTFAGSHHASATFTVPGDVTSVNFTLSPTGAVSHTGITIVPIDEFGNEGIATQKIAFGSYQNDLPPIATDDAFDAVEDTNLLVNAVDGVLLNDVDTDNTPGASPLTARLVSGPANGTLILGSTGSVSYTPNADFSGTDSFVYRVYDGRFYSDNATVTITVAPVNDAPDTLDDYYFADRDTPISIDAAAGVLANDSDADGDALTVAIVNNPTGGTVTLNADGSFDYTPNAGFNGVDTFTYIATDGVLDSRVTTVSIEVTLPPTKFFVVDTDLEQQFEYAADGTLTDNYALHRGNKGSQGAAASSDGSTVWVMNGNKRVFVYDDAGAYLGRWLAVGPSRVDGIATDDTDIWILDRKLDMVFHYEGAAALRSGEMEATDSFALHTNNKQGRGITTDGVHIWIVNDIRTKDKVYKYDIAGNYVARWNIDPANSKPTGITIDPTGASDAVWIVDNLSDSVYQYDGGATRTGGSVVADSVFTLDGTNTNPQGIADPPPATGRVASVRPASPSSGDSATHHDLALAGILSADSIVSRGAEGETAQGGYEQVATIVGSLHRSGVSLTDIASEHEPTWNHDVDSLFGGWQEDAEQAESLDALLVNDIEGVYASGDELE